MQENLFIAVQASVEAASEVYRQYRTGFETIIKPDNSPVTSADLAANDILISGLAQTNIPVYSEEGPYLTEEIVNSGHPYWILDPIDGTKDFVNHTDEFVICTGLVGKNTALAGVLVAPAMGLLYFAGEELGSFKYMGNLNELMEHFSLKNWENLVRLSTKMPLQSAGGHYKFLTSRYHKDPQTEAYFQQLQQANPNIERVECGSAIKLGLIAEGCAHEYTRFLSVNFWDIAAGHAVAKYAGISVVDPQTKEEIDYSATNLRVNGYSLKSFFDPNHT